MKLIDAEPLEELLHSRVAQCSNDYGSLAGAIAGCLKLVQAQPVISPQPNAPLTLEELQKLDGEAVWVDDFSWEAYWGMVFNYSDSLIIERCNDDGYAISYCKDTYGKKWLAYRRKPEEAANG